MTQQALGEAHEVAVEQLNGAETGKDEQSSSEGPEPKRRKLMTGGDVSTQRQVTGVNGDVSKGQQLIDVTGVAYPSIVLSPTALETLRLLNVSIIISVAGLKSVINDLCFAGSRTVVVTAPAQGLATSIKR